MTYLRPVWVGGSQSLSFIYIYMYIYERERGSLPRTESVPKKESVIIFNTLVPFTRGTPHLKSGLVTGPDSCDSRSRHTINVASEGRLHHSGESHEAVLFEGVPLLMHKTIYRAIKLIFPRDLRGFIPEQ